MHGLEGDVLLFFISCSTVLTDFFLFYFYMCRQLQQDTGFVYADFPNEDVVKRVANKLFLAKYVRHVSCLLLLILFVVVNTS